MATRSLLAPCTCVLAAQRPSGRSSGWGQSWNRMATQSLLAPCTVWNRGRGCFVWLLCGQLARRQRWRPRGRSLGLQVLEAWLPKLLD